jgi:hypothetical protein
MLASDDRNPQFVGARNPDDILHVNFYMRSLQDNYRSEKEGRPIFHDVPYVTIQIPGNQLSIIDTEVREEHKVRFPRQWQQFQNKQAVTTTGTPVEEWPAITRSRAEELKGIKFFTVEQIADCSDLQAQALGMEANTLRLKAKAYLSNASDTALAQRLAAENAKKDAEMKAMQDAHARELADLRKLIEDRTAGNAGTPAPAKRKYTRKAQPQVSG